MLPEDCISYIISLTSPRDACRSSLVCPLFKCAIDSDLVWRKFLPHDYHQILSNSASAPSMGSLSKKQLFFHLLDHPILVDDGKMSFAIDKKSGKICCMIGARRLTIMRGNINHLCSWRSLPNNQSRFSEAAEIEHVMWLKIKGRIETNILSPQTTYAVYFVYKVIRCQCNFDVKPVTVRVNFEGEEVHGHGDGNRRVLLLNPSRNIRGGWTWMKVKIGEFFNDGGENHGVVEFSLMETKKSIAFGILVEGIELRPKAVR